MGFSRERMRPIGELKSGREAFKRSEVGRQNQPFDTEIIP
jgi:hypothetical protein